MKVSVSGKVASAALAVALEQGVKLDRTATRHLLKMLKKLDSDVAGCAVMQAQLRTVLARRDWTVISLQVNPATVRETGVSVGIVEGKR